jgi:RNA polymerase sigma-70 factor (ECF subfamily)
VLDSHSYAAMTKNNTKRFQKVILPHLDAAYNYALWLSRNRHDAEDLTQEACTRALAAFARFKHTNPRAWLLTIVRHTFFSQQQQTKQRGEVVYLDSFSEHINEHTALHTHDTPEQHLIRQAEKAALLSAMNKLSPEFREIIVLRELEGFSYDELAQILDCAIGTVMSRLARARDKLRGILQKAQHRSEQKA